MTTGDFPDIPTIARIEKYRLDILAYYGKQQYENVQYFEKADMSDILEPEKLAPYNDFKLFTPENIKNIN